MLYLIKLKYCKLINPEANSVSFHKTKNYKNIIYTLNILIITYNFQREILRK